MGVTLKPKFVKLHIYFFLFHNNFFSLADWQHPEFLCPNRLKRKKKRISCFLQEDHGKHLFFSLTNTYDDNITHLKGVNKCLQLKLLGLNYRRSKKKMKNLYEERQTNLSKKKTLKNYVIICLQAPAPQLCKFKCKSLKNMNEKCAI